MPLTWVIAQPATSPSMTAPAAIPTTNTIVIEGDLVASGTPVGTSPTTLKPAATYTPFASLSAGAPIPFPTMTATVVPTAVGTFSVKPGQFVLRIGSGTATAEQTYTCTLPVTATPASATPLPLSVVVASPSSTTTSSTPTPTTTTSRTPKPTHTVYETVTSTPKAGKTKKKSPAEQVTKKPDGGAATGGGGDAGPDGRMFVMAGTILVFGAGVGGLMMRRRRPQRG
ncbi:hypothetical protein [Sphaerisporangium fuscum]|uniref:hypothetical protein n=1 Tax=Sphaerisporangium fuscum TaxID=2835868 RepID=UPI001BDC616D|nr:hypothetical protein [Sphaerisporangium fuscum]